MKKLELYLKVVALQRVIQGKTTYLCRKRREERERGETEAECRAELTSVLC